MFLPRGQFGMARYRSVDLASRIEGASPHQLVQIMFDEAVKALETMAVAAEKGDYVQRGLRQSRALSIIHGLEGSLDHQQGGDIAAGLAAIYREARRLAIAGGRDNDPAMIRKAGEMLGDIAGAWQAIGERGAA